MALYKVAVKAHTIQFFAKNDVIFLAWFNGPSWLPSEITRLGYIFGIRNLRLIKIIIISSLLS